MASDIKMVFEAETAPIDRAVRLLDKLEAELRDVDRAMDKGLTTKEQYSAETLRLTKNIQRLKVAAQGSAKDFRRFEKSMYNSGKAARANEVAMQQAGYQVQDFIVQVQAGTNPLIAFSQQGSQLAGFFAGPWGAAIGLGIAAVGFLGTALLGLGEKADTVKDQIEDLNDALSLYGDLSSQISDSKALSEEFGNLAAQAKSMLEALQQIQNITLNKQISEFGGLGKVIREAVYERDKDAYMGLGIKTVTRFNSNQVGAASEFLGVSDKPLGEATEYAGQYLKLLEALQKAEGLKEQAAAAGQLSKFLKGHVNSYELSEETTKNISAMQETLLKITQLQGKEQQKLAVQEKRAATVKVALRSRFILLRDKEAQKETELLRNSAAARAAMDASAIAKTEEREKAEYEAYQRGVDQRFEGEEALFQQAVSLSNDLRDKIKSDASAAARAYENAFNASSFLFANRFQDETALMGMPVTVDPDNKPDDKTSKKGPKPTTIEDTIKSYRRQMATEKALMSLTGQRRREEELFLELKYANQDADIKTSKARLRGLAEEMAAMEERSQVIEEAAQEQKEMQDFISQSFESGFMSIIDGTQSVKDAFRSMARDIIAELYRVLVVKKLVSAATGFFGFADGGVFQGGSQVQAFANGGVVGGPTFFPMSGGKTGLMGEAGPEAIMPLKRGKNGKLGVEASGESGNVTVVQNFSFSANGDDSVKKIIAQEAPKIAQMTQQQILESRKRGGSFRKAFG